MTTWCPACIVVFVAGCCRHCCPEVSSATTAGVSAAWRPLLLPLMQSLFLQLLPLTYQLPWSWPVAPQKSILVDILLNRKSILVKRHASMARRREHLSAYLRICISGRQQNHKKIQKNQERIIRYRLKKMFLRVLMHIYVSVIFSRNHSLNAVSFRSC